MLSVITISFNSKATIEQTFQSILNQTFKEQFEYVVIDGGSTDGTKEIIIDYEKKFKARNIDFKWVSEPDKGIYDAMNKGILMSSGEIIGILNSDDFYENDALLSISNAINHSPGIDIYYGFLRILMPDGKELQVYRYCYENYLGKLGSGCESAAQHPTCFIRRALYDRIGFYCLEFRTAADYEFLIRAKVNNAKFLGLNAIISNFRNNGISSNISDFERLDQRVKTYLKHGLISEKELIAHKKNLKYYKYKTIKRKIINFLFGMPG